MIVAVALDLRWEYVPLAAAVCAGIGYVIKLLRRVAQGLDRWDSIPAMADDIVAIRHQVVPLDVDPEVKLPPLHQRVRILEMAVAAIRQEMATAEDLVAHTEQDAENFTGIDAKLDGLAHLIEHPPKELSR